MMEGQAENLEAPIGFEPMHKGFADLSLTTWVRRHYTLTDLIITKPGKEVSVNGFPGSKRPFVFKCRGKSSDVYSHR